MQPGRQRGPDRASRRAPWWALVVVATALAGACGSSEQPTVVAPPGDPEPTTAPADPTTTTAPRAPLEVSDAVATAVTDAASDQGLVRWTTERLDVRIEGVPTARDLEILEASLVDLEAASGLELVVGQDPDADISVLFAPRDDWPIDLQEITDHVLGVARSTWNGDGQLVEVRVAIDSGVGQAGRNQTIVHELVHALGIGHVTCATSVVHGGGTGAPGWTLTPLDHDLVRTWYAAGLRVGDDAAQLADELVVVTGGPTCEPQLLEAAETPAGTLWCELAGGSSQPCLLVDGLGAEPLAPFGERAERWSVDGLVYDHDPARYEAFDFEGRRLLCERTTQPRWPCQFTDGPGPLTSTDAWTDGQLVYDAP